MFAAFQAAILCSSLETHSDLQQVLTASRTDMGEPQQSYLVIDFLCTKRRVLAGAFKAILRHNKEKVPLA